MKSVLLFVAPALALIMPAAAQSPAYSDAKCAALFGLFAEGQETAQPGSKEAKGLAMIARKLQERALPSFNGDTQALATAMAAERPDLVGNFEALAEEDGEAIMIDCAGRVGVKM